MISDVLIVGSGASAVHAAFPLVKAGFTVRMLDVGHDDHVYRSLIPEASFLEIRKMDSHQHRYFLGDRFEGIPWGVLRTGAQLTPPRQYICQGTEQCVPLASQTFFPTTSLAFGGLASGWGAGALAYNQTEMHDFPISAETLAPYYQKVAEQIGISGEQDDLSPFEGSYTAILPPLRINKNATTLLQAYQRRRTTLNAAGFYMGKPRLAALSQAYRGRGPESYRDMSFWSDRDQSVWRPRYAVEELQGYSNFTYERSLLVHSFKEGPDGCVEIAGKDMTTDCLTSYWAKKLILAAGIFGTTRIVLKSLNAYGVSRPLVCTPYTYYVLLNSRMLGQLPSEADHSLAQLSVVYAPPTNPQTFIYTNVHSYRSLLNFKIIKELPLPYYEGMRLAQLLIPSLAILAVNHEDRPSPDKYCVLRPGDATGPDTLDISFSVPDGVTQQRRRHEAAMLRHFWSLGCFVLKRVWPGHGASIHYGGTFPMNRSEQELTVDTDGRLRGMQSVHIVDNSIFPYLPAKALTFTLMANAHRIGDHLCTILKT